MDGGGGGRGVSFGSAQCIMGEDSGPSRLTDTNENITFAYPSDAGDNDMD